jgi:acyl-CoA thioester hydrolase
MNQSDINQLNWDFGPPSFYRIINVVDKHIYVMGHTNNVVYVSWLEDVAWGHSQALGLGWEKYSELNRAMVARRHEVDYLAATFAGDTLVMGTWITENDQKLSIARRYQLIRPEDGVSALRGCTKWVCVAIDSGRPKRMPPEFIDGYAITAC